MKKNLLAVILSTMMVASMMVACGSEEAPVEDTQVEADATDDAEDAEDVDADAACSDETFAQLQEDYAALVEAYNVVVEVYGDDSVEADENINNALSATADIMTQMGEITQDSITEADAATLEGSIVDLLDVLGAVVDSMEVTE